MAVVIADASPLIGLARVNGLKWLPHLFGVVHVTPIVKREVLPGLKMTDEAALSAAFQSGALQDWSAPIAQHLDQTIDLDEGERQSIDLALCLHAQQPSQESLLLMDERVGRAVAIEMKLRVAGTAAIIGMAKKQGLITAAKPVFAKLHGSDFRISAAVIATALQSVGES